MNEATLTKFILSYLVDKPDYVELDTEQQQLIFQTCRTIMMAIYNAIKYENVYPVILCGDAEAKYIISKAIKSGLANLSNASDGESIQKNDFYISEAYVDQGPTMKRFRPAAMGRATPILKRSSHLTLKLKKVGSK